MPCLTLPNRSDTPMTQSAVRQSVDYTLTTFTFDKTHYEPLKSDRL